MSKHYIRLDENMNIIKGFSDAFESPLGKDICINENGQRHFEMFGEVNPSLINGNGIYIYKYIDNSFIAKTDAEIQTEIELLTKEPTAEERLQSLEDAMIFLTLGGM